MTLIVGSLLASWLTGFLIGWNTRMIRMAVNAA